MVNLERSPIFKPVQTSLRNQGIRSYGIHLQTSVRNMFIYFVNEIQNDKVEQKW